MSSKSEFRAISIRVDYLFGKGVSRALPKEGYRLQYSRRSGRLKLIEQGGKIFATVKTNGALALSIHGASILSRSPGFRENFVEVRDEAAPFVRGGKSVFCKFVKSAGKNIYPKSEVAVVDSKGRVLGVGMAVLNGKHMTQFKSGVAVKVRTGVKP